MSWKDIRVTSWQELVTVLDETAAGPGAHGRFPRRNYLYRGQADTAWGLKPLLTRLVSPREFTRADVHELERDAIREFKAEAHRFLSPYLVQSTVDCGGWWSLMQHYGVPTRLVDWTSSPYIATYFAVSEEFESDGALWLLHPDVSNALRDPEAGTTPRIPDDPKEMESFFLDERSGEELFVVSRGIRIERISNQRGLFSICRNCLADHAELIARQFGGVEFPRIVIPAALKFEALKRLRSMNISALSMFPDLFGLGREIAERIHTVNR